MHVGVDLCECLHGRMSAHAITSACVITNQPARAPEGAEWLLNITVLLPLPYLMTTVITTVWCSMGVCVTAFDPSNSTHNFRKRKFLTHWHKYTHYQIVVFFLRAVALCVIMHQAHDLSGSQWRETMESMRTKNSVIMTAKLSSHLCKSESSL